MAMGAELCSLFDMTVSSFIEERVLHDFFFFFLYFLCPHQNGKDNYFATNSQTQGKKNNNKNSTQQMSGPKQCISIYVLLNESHTARHCYIKNICYPETTTTTKRSKEKKKRRINE